MPYALRPGDLVFNRDIPLTMKLVGQFHVGICYEEDTGEGPQIVEATTEHQCNTWDADKQAGILHVYRPTGPIRGYGPQAAEIAYRWGSDWRFRHNDRPIPYAGSAAYFSPFHLSSFGDRAQERATEYARCRVGDFPRNFRGAKFRSAGVFCSHLVIAAYQSAFGVESSRVWLALDAVHTSPKHLKWYFDRHGAVWRHLRELPAVPPG